MGEIVYCVKRERMIYKFFVKIGRDRNGMTAGKRNLVYLLYGFETCRKNLGLYVVVVEDLHDLFCTVNTVGYAVVSGDGSYIYRQAAALSPSGEIGILM